MLTLTLQKLLFFFRLQEEVHSFLSGRLQFFVHGRIQPQPLGFVVKEMYKATDKEALLAIPFFVMAGALMTDGSIARRLLEMARAAPGWIPGGRGADEPDYDFVTPLSEVVPRLSELQQHRLFRPLLHAFEQHWDLFPP